jgi:hypothetical protein
VSKPTAKLDLQTNPNFQKTEWRAQRIGWMVWSLIVLAACLGLLGPGWLSDREVASADGAITVRFERFLHYHHPSQVEVTCAGAPLAGEAFGISVERSLLDRMQIRRIEPAPEHHQMTSDGIIYGFRRDPEAGPVKVVFHVEYERYGSVEGDIALAGADSVTLRQFVYP